MSARSGSLSIVLWAFGLATTLLLVGLWGRAVVHDQPTIESTARSVVDAEIASDRIYNWIGDGLESSSDVDPETAQLVMAEIEQHPEVEAVVGSLVDQFVGALFVAEGDAVDIDLVGTLTPVVPLFASALRGHGETIDDEAIAAALEEAEKLDLSTGDLATAVRVVDDARSLLSVIVVLSTMTLILTGGSAVALSSDRPVMVRTLATRLVLSAISFAVLFRVGSWVLDPEGGGSPVASGGSVLLGSNAHVFVLPGVVGALVAAGVAVYVWRTRRRRSSETTSESSDDTRELVRI